MYSDAHTKLTSDQPSFVSLATNILTGLHAMCLFAVTLWFVYQLKHDSVLAGWIRIVIKPVTKAVEWVNSTIKAVLRYIGSALKQLSDKYRRNKLHLLRNIFWYFYSLQSYSRSS